MCCRLELAGAACDSYDELVLLFPLLIWPLRHPSLRRLALFATPNQLHAYAHSVACVQGQNPNLRITLHLPLYGELLPLECGFDAFLNHPGFSTSQTCAKTSVQSCLAPLLLNVTKPREAAALPLRQQPAHSTSAHLSNRSTNLRVQLFGSRPRK